MRTRRHNAALTLLFAALPAAAFTMSGCASEPVGYSKTTTKTTTDTPSEKTTVTETREKETTITPR